MANERLEDSHIEWHKHKKLKKAAKITWKALLALLVAAWVTTLTCVEDAKIHKRKKDADKELYWEFKVTGKDAIVFPTDPNWWPDPLNDSIKIPLDTILEYNRDMISIDATKLESIMLWEESLKTNKKFLWIFNLKDLDSWLEKHWITRDSNSESWIRKMGSKRKKWSYWPYQLQLDAINKYKGDPELCDQLCEKIAKFKLPDTEWKLKPLHEQLWLTVEEMVDQIKNNTLYAFSWGGRFLVVYWIVLIDQISRESESIIDSYNWDAWYSRRESNTKEVEKDHPELVWHKSNDNIMSPYFLFNDWKVSYNEIWNLFNNDIFRNGMVSAYWCMDYINNIKNSDYLFILSLLELNKRFEGWGKWELNIVTPTWNFWPSTMALVNEHFNQNFNKYDEAEKFMDNLSVEEKQKLKDTALNKFEQNMRLLYTLNHDKNWINQIQSKYLSECLDITFNHMYAGVNVFSKFIDDVCWKNSISINDKLYTYRDSYISDQDKESLENIKKIMTNEEAFLSFTWLSKKSYLLRIKSYLCPALLWSTDRIYQTWWIIPVIQDHEGWKWKRFEEWIVNESNSIYRLDLWVKQEQIAQADKERWVEYILQPWDTNIDSLKNIMRSEKPVREYLQKCKTVNWDTITSPHDIPDELVIQMLRGDDGFYPLFEDKQWFYEWDTIYIKYIWLENVHHIVEVDHSATKEVEKKIYVIKSIKKKWKKKPLKKREEEIVKEKIKLCNVNSDGTLTIQKWWTFQEILYIYSQNNPNLKKILESIVWKPITQQSDINQNVIKKVIKHPDWSEWGSINKASPGDKFIIVVPLNY